ncbi:hypothetical protein LOZ53_003392 [Ophidiomyces ophidiicola]|nr:hypothetical protein LOZ55_004956 [Ophidiomyces ophidiicola]KAI1987311.1 hypothetical protein LOZ51_005778 [Ophidiomyces ophidiicola]KAI1990033.1 hypothetical protein LOZ53_003392 [Ophidiomyces ophidiicola]KAI1990237.1 hypothetical protein LOZ54_002562 [Ophidiomyces ophidiicola]
MAWLDVRKSTHQASEIYRFRFDLGVWLSLGAVPTPEAGDLADIVLDSGCRRDTRNRGRGSVETAPGRAEERRWGLLERGISATFGIWGMADDELHSRDADTLPQSAALTLAGAAREGMKSKAAGLIRFSALETLASSCTSVFRESYFKPQRPVVLPRGRFRELPAASRWFVPVPLASDGDVSSLRSLNVGYLSSHRDCYVPLELTTRRVCEDGHLEESFKRFHAPLGLFLDWTRSIESSSLGNAAANAEASRRPDTRLYLAQCQLLDLTPQLRDDLPTPSYVSDAGKGDIYDTNIWVGVAPTYTPLHRDPNPNIFVQLAGSKHVRLLPPSAGLAIFNCVSQRLGRNGGAGSAVFRGDDMMYGPEKDLLEREIWGEQDTGSDVPAMYNDAYETVVHAGDGIFIPMGWWHSIRGVGMGITASVSVIGLGDTL